MKKMIYSLVVLSGLACTALATEYYVATTGSDDNNGKSWATAVQNLQIGVYRANQVGDVVWVSNGTYTVTAGIWVGNAMTVKSLNGAEQTIVAGGYPATTNRCFYLGADNIVLDGFTITNGYKTDETGGGVISYKTNTIKNCIFSGNHSDQAGGGLSCKSTLVTNCVFRNNTTPTGKGTGGGVYLQPGSMMVDCTVVSNRAYNGGGAFVTGSENVLVKNCRIAYNSSTGTEWDGFGGGIYLNENAGTLQDSEVSNNTARWGGGIYCRTGSIVTNCLITENFAPKEGGGVIVNTGGTVVDCRIIGNQGGDAASNGGGGGLRVDKDGRVKNSLIAQNLAYRNGGGAYVLGGIFENCTIISNSTFIADGFGGGLDCYSNSPKITNCLVAANTASTAGGGISFGSTLMATVQNCTIYGNSLTNSTWSESGGVRPADGVLIQNTIMYANTAISSPDANVAVGIYSNCCTSVISGMNGGGNIAANPLLSDPAAGDYRLQGQSPCVNAGINQPWMSTAIDLAGKPRLDQRSGIVDIGAYEYLPFGTIFVVR